MNILGLSAPRHNAAAALLNECGIKAAIEESKLLRSPSSSGFPVASIRFCLESAGGVGRNLDLIAIASRHSCRDSLRNVGLQKASTAFPLIPSSYCDAKRAGLELERSRTLQQANGTSGVKTVRFDHHLCHAASAFYASPFDRALILIMDGGDEGHTGAVAMGEGSRIRILESMVLPHSLALVYSRITELLGFKPQVEEHKTQWLSLCGQPVFRDVFVKMLRGSSNGTLHFDLSYFNSPRGDHFEFSDKLYNLLGISRHNPEQWLEIAPEIASSLQDACAILITELLESWRQRTGATRLCLGGRLFFNPLLVGALERNTGFEDIFVQPAPGNAGSALGAAWLAWHHLLGRPRQGPVSHVYWGPSYTADQVKRVLDNCKAAYRWFRTEAEINDEAVRLLRAGKIVAWCQGEAEFGPRALGNRSLLASPWAPYVKENLNDFVKHREWFRPFAVAVPEEDCSRYFECSRQGYFMTSIGWVKSAGRDLIKEFVLPGNRVRLQVVSRESNPTFWALLKKFAEFAPAPILVNASFNLFGEPLVISPRDAVRGFFSSGIDALVINGFLLSKG